MMFWYLYVLMAYYIILLVVGKVRHLWVIFMVSIFAQTAMLLQFGYATHTDDFHQIYKMIYHLPTFVLGMLLASDKDKLVQNIATHRLYTMTLLTFALILYLSVHSVTNHCADVLLTIIENIAGAFIVYTIFLRTSHLSGNKFLIKIGRYALEIYVLHVFFTAGLRSLLPKLGVADIYASISLNMVLSIGISILIGYALKKVGLHTLVFRPFKLLPSPKS